MNWNTTVIVSPILFCLFFLAYIVVLAPPPWLKRTRLWKRMFEP